MRAALAVRHSYPLWLAQLFVKEFGSAQAAGLMEAGNAAPERCLRVNPLAGDWDAAAERLAADGLTADRGGRLPGSGPDRGPAGGAHGGFPRRPGHAAVARLAAGRAAWRPSRWSRGPRSPTSARPPA